MLIAVWLLLQRTRIGMIIRAGVQDSEMVEALGINVRRVFTIVFGLGVGLATLGGVLRLRRVGCRWIWGHRLLLSALIALAIGGLTSFPGAAFGAILVGLIQQFIIKYGQIGIQIPFLEEPFKPSPPLVPASVVLIMVIILLVLPNAYSDGMIEMKNNSNLFRRSLRLIVLMIVMVALPFVVAILDGQSVESLLANETGNAKFVQGLMIEVFILAIYALSYDLVLGVTGLLSFGHAMFFATGAYFTGIAFKNSDGILRRH